MNGQISARNTNTFWLLGLTDEDTGALISDLSGTWEIRTAKYPAGTVVATGSIAHVSGGDYKANVPSSASLTPGTKYVRRLFGTSPTAGDYDAEDYFIAADRTGRTPTT